MQDTSAAAAVSALAIAQGMGPIKAENIQNGVMEMWIDIAHLAAVSSEMASRVLACGEIENFFGVYAYEVDEQLGGLLGELTCGTDEAFDGPNVKMKLGEIALGFFKKSYSGEPIPLHETRRIVKELTGYVEPGYVEPEADLVTVRLTMDVTFRRNGVPISDLQANLDDIPDHVSGNGMLTASIYQAEVESREHKVEVISVE